MNCANHSQNPAAAYCRTCGKALCTQCTRKVAGVIYCENCLAERMAGAAPATTQYQPSAAGYAIPPQPTSGPHPAIAGILAGFFPFGVGAVYCGQYAKGLAHLIVFVLLIVGQANTDSNSLHIVLGFGIAAFYLYQLIDAIKSAKALQTGQPVPDPFGFNTMFSPGDHVHFSRSGVPAGAIVLIGLGVLFLLHNLGIWFLEVDRIWPIFLIFLGVWLYVKRKTSAGDSNRSIAGPAMLITIGGLWLIDNLHGPSWDRTWPVILLVLGVIKLMERGYLGGPPSSPLNPPAGSTTSQQPPTEVNTEVKNG